MKITDMIISAILKKGILYEARNTEMEFEIPFTQKTAEGETLNENKIKIQFKAEHMTLRLQKEEMETAYQERC